MAGRALLLIGRFSSLRLFCRDYGIWMALLLGIALPILYAFGVLSIDKVNMIGRYLALALVALSLDLVWG